MSVSEQDESVYLEPRGSRSGQWAAAEGDVDSRVDGASESWRVPRSVANPSRLRLGAARQAMSAGVSDGL
ncbi:hypothetical protein [Frankia sp. CiP3]|uniref:hypothetical protein n=1 Tax=Frankia sp. CiP3 TaxID=2880971 RepID=UPI001EF48ED7|nr:hypothetical protein [Frankia sp. CiP3]